MRGQVLRASDGVIDFECRKELTGPAVFGTVGLPQRTHQKPPITLKTLLNAVHPLRRFVYQTVRLVEHNEQLSLEARIRARTNSKPRCSGCGQACAGYDRMSTERRFAFIPLWNIPVDLLYTMRRVDCPDCGVKVEKVPWADGKHATCNVFRHFLGTWARRLSWNS